MLHESHKTKELKVNDVNLSFSEIYRKPYFPHEHEESIKKANLLLLPFEGMRGFEKPVFPEETMSFYNYIREYENNELIPDICISDQDYHELELHADLITLPLLLLDKVVLPIAIGLITHYLTQKQVARKRDLKVKVNVTVVDGDKSKSLSYEGDVDQFEETVKAASDNLFNS
ncbi:hypothetical protein [Mesobacillus selenatarsenatis]|uniref:Uncharacterized protein n=1 Tax=Mesobacillus selenatarsenatis (strain DSM 18680 / JCM 14380 / FERM P-15431 / SF-1) TaxID=1321606 RepID=A0A0A8X425_MESS1|nr:hypothetical protein [Mesobacillus selenatarsenatis]GAM12866.1 hypothetical protein SAMD00020551_1001 [Mesobacillus selenatarsenatis SF-1]